MQHPHHHPLLKTVRLVVLASLLPLLASAQNQATPRSYEVLPGYLDLAAHSELESFETVTEINLRPNILRFVKTAAKRNKPDFAEAMAGVQFVQVRVFEVSERIQETMESSFQGLKATIENAGWERVVKVDEPDETVGIYTLSGIDDTIDGLAVLVLNAEEAVIVNIVGTIDVALLSAMGEGLDLDALEGLENEIQSGS